MSWLLLVIAGLFEVGFAGCLGQARLTEGNTRIWWLVGFVACLIVSMTLLYKAVQTLPVGTAYAVWTGIGAAGTAVLGMIFFKEPADAWRLFFLFTLIASIIGLKVVSS
jgi:quaternary ammonium compound-resistance protein SugE